MPNFFIDKFRIPPFLLPIYQAAGIEYGVRWEVLAAINEIETDYGRNLNVSTAGAVGWMQFMPSTWKRYGVDANHDGRKDPYNPVDAIFAAARYLKAAGADQDVRGAVFAYNHADWYVDSVLHARASDRRPARRPRRLAHRPDAGALPRARQGPLRRRHRRQRALAKKRIKKGNAAVPVTSSSTRKGINVFAAAGSPVIAVQDGKIVKMGAHRSPGQVHPAARRLRQHLHLRASEEAVARLPGAQGEDGLRRAGQAGAASRGAQEGPQADRPGQRRHAGQAEGARRRAGRRAAAPPRPPALGSAAARGPQGAAVRQPQPPGRLRRRRRGAAAQRGQRHPGLHDLQVLLHAASTA